MDHRFCIQALFFSIALGTLSSGHAQEQEYLPPRADVGPSASPAATASTAPAAAKSPLTLERSLGFTKGARLPLAAGTADVLSTYVGLQQAGLKEGNSLINTSNWGLAGLFVLKVGLVYYADQQPPETRKPILKATSGFWTLGAVNNLLLIAGASNPVSLASGIVAGIYAYYAEGRILEEEDRAAAGRLLQSTAEPAAAPQKRAAVQIRYLYDKPAETAEPVEASPPPQPTAEPAPAPPKRAAVEIRRHYDTF
ncbi:MAG: hypothetical protein GAK30_02503 [Paracidovorax wautersii]|uniref:Uncharacterized protein n=1 Tax=Paracidovorax wautersii TaxID=1177982 RepID=A0A7V8FMW6_9BURK|nr:MAG: hypothetical protein GAK30_02503 [Paracidovorax wautersii]